MQCISFEFLLLDFFLGNVYEFHEKIEFQSSMNGLLEFIIFLVTSHMANFHEFSIYFKIRYVLFDNSSISVIMKHSECLNFLKKYRKRYTAFNPSQNTPPSFHTLILLFLSFSEVVMEVLFCECLQLHCHSCYDILI